MTEGPVGVRSPQAHLEWEAASLDLQEQWANKTCSIGFLSNSQPSPGRSLWRGGFRPLPLTDSHWAKGIPPVLEIIKKRLNYSHPLPLIIGVVDDFVTDKRGSALPVHHMHHFHWLFVDKLKLLSIQNLNVKWKQYNTHIFIFCLIYDNCEIWVH